MRGRAMCGIAGIFGAGAENVAELRQMLSLIAHRGEPNFQDQIGVGDGFCIGANRLAIVDQGGGAQPTLAHDGDVVCVHNGEIYNHAALRTHLSTVHRFSSVCDSEIIPAAWLAFGPELASHFDGMFAFGLHDRRTGSWLLARDPVGIKPLYYCFRNSSVYFASELKALTQIGVDEVYSLPPGCILTPAGVRAYCKVPVFAESAHDDVDGLETVRQSLMLAVKSHLPESKEPVAVLLSGGVDSSTILYLTRLLHAGPVEAFTISVDGAESQDRFAAEHLCRHLGVPLRLVFAKTSELQQFYLARGVYMTETFEPALVRNATLYHFVCRAVRAFGYKFCISGEGADEVFGGYQYFNQAPAAMRESLIHRSLTEIGMTYLQMADRASMYATLEVRVPYLDFNFIRVAARLPPELRIQGNMNKVALRMLFPKEIPDANRLRPKIGMNGGAGFGSNDPNEGIYAEAVATYYRDKTLRRADFESIKTFIQPYDLLCEDQEEVYNFARFIEYGFHKMKVDRRRLQLNVSGLRRLAL